MLPCLVTTGFSLTTIHETTEVFKIQYVAHLVLLFLSVTRAGMFQVEAILAAYGPEEG